MPVSIRSAGCRVLVVRRTRHGWGHHRRGSRVWHCQRHGRWGCSNGHWNLWRCNWWKRYMGLRRLNCNRSVGPWASKVCNSVDCMAYMSRRARESTVQRRCGPGRLRQRLHIHGRWWCNSLRRGDMRCRLAVGLLALVTSEASLRNKLLSFTAKVVHVAVDENLLLSFVDRPPLQAHVDPAGDAYLFTSMWC